MKIALLEDDVVFAKEIVTMLEQAGLEVVHFESGRACMKGLSDDVYDMALFDWELPDMSGKDVLKSLKNSGNCPPVMFLTGRDAEEDIIEVIDAGADDYIVKPPSMKVLLARINALYRRTTGSDRELGVVEFGNLTVDFSKRTFECDGKVIKLTEKETDLALYFFKEMGTLLSRAHLTKVIWGSSPDIDTRTIDVHVSHLRSKLKLSPSNGWRLVSVYQKGYRLERLE